jgi:hypothetical protein
MALATGKVPEKNRRAPGASPKKSFSVPHYFFMHSLHYYV